MNIPDVILKIREFKFMGKITLSNRVRSDCSPVEVDIYFDEQTKTAYQIDNQSKMYRVAKPKEGNPSEYGEWQRA